VGGRGRLGGALRGVRAAERPGRHGRRRAGTATAGAAGAAAAALQAGGKAGGSGAGAARGRYLSDPAALCAVARHCRANAALISVARQTLPRHRSAAPVFATSPFCRATMHGAALAFRRAMTIDAAKSVSLKKTVLDLKLVYKKC